MMKKQFLTIFAFCFCFDIFGESQKFSVEDAVSFALSNNISIEQKKISFDALERAYSHSWNSASPSLSVGAGASIPTTGDSNYDYQFNINASVSVSLSANLYTSIKSAKLNYEIGKITFDEAVRAVELSVRQQFYNLLYEKENISLQENNVSLARTQYNANRAKYNQGRLSEIDVLSAEVEWKSEQPKLESARAQFQNDLDSFKQILGIPLGEEVELDGNLKDAIPKEKIEISTENLSSPEIRTLEKKIESAKNGVLSARFSAYSPTLSASWKWQDVWTKPDSTNSNPKDSSTLTLSATIPLDGVLPWSQKNDKIDDAKDSLQSAELELQNAKITLKRTAESALRTIELSRSTISAKEANVTLARRSYSMTREAYERGTKDLVALQNAQKSLTNARTSLASEQLSLIKALLSLESTLGLPFGSLKGDD